MQKSRNSCHDEQGFVLVTALLILLILTIIGITTTRNTTTELQIAGNDKIHKKTFYDAEAGAMLGAELLEQSFNCPTGFVTNFNDGTYDVRDLPDDRTATIRVYPRGPVGSEDLILWNNDYPALADIGDITKADAAYPIAKINSGDDVGHLYFGGQTSMLPGGALQQLAGYEGKGKAASQGGVAKLFDIYSQFDGLSESQSIIMFGWRHLVGSEDTSLCID